MPQKYIEVLKYVSFYALYNAFLYQIYLQLISQLTNWTNLNIRFFFILWWNMT